ncbi:MAG TPA: Stk1 family PASTA domain-containing Ser/Thr kinase [Actinomycetota bacterium]|nr:Stk1 family PASTA domain-containing Ser/Thr kinase [Actinomycetota bacterium]
MNEENKKFGGRYVVIALAGRGGMADVYRARDELLGREVAVKVLNERLSDDRTFVERFRREAQAAANLNHPNIVSLYDFGADNSSYYIVMEYIDGKTLGDIIKEEGPLMPERAAEIGVDVARALERAHAASLVHRDIGKGNVMINSHGQTKVTDFGIARALSGDNENTMTQTGMVIGTAAYLSPEQAQGAPVDQRSDIYSLGCVLYEMLVGRPPFTGDTPLSVAYRHVRENPNPPSTVNPDLPKALDAIVMKALAKNPANRYQNATEMREDLERYLAGQKVHATPLMAPETAVGTQVMRETQVQPPPPEKSRAGWWILGAFLLLGLIALGYFLLAGAPTVEVPDVVGETQREAIATLEQAGLEPEVDKQPSEGPEGRVFEQNPAAGDEVEEGDTVTLLVSSGPQKVGVPDLTGLEKKDAEKELKDLNLKLGEETPQFSDEVPEGEIIDQDPQPGEKVEPESSVNIVVSAGVEPVLVPSVVESSEDAAVAEIEAAGLVPEVITEPNEDFDEGIVFDQDPDGGAEVAPNSTVQILVSEGPEPFELPDVTGEDADDAQAELEDLGLVVSQVEEPCADPSIPPDAVCRTDPPANSEVEQGDEVTLFLPN